MILKHFNQKLVTVAEYLIAQLKTGFRQKAFRLKTYPQGLLQGRKSQDFIFIFTTSL